MPLIKLAPQPWTVVGVDNGNRLAAVLSPGGLLTRARLRVAKLAEPDPAKRAYLGYQWARETIELAQEISPHPVHVFIEGPFISPQTMSAAIPLSRLQGAVMAGAYAAGAAAVHNVTSSQWKLGVYGRGHGNADKDYISRWTKTNWPWLFETALVAVPKAMRQDVLDAGSVMLYGAQVMRRTGDISEGLKNGAA